MSWTRRIMQRMKSAMHRRLPLMMSCADFEEFMLEHYWGYNQHPSSDLVEYQVQHPRFHSRWRGRPGRQRAAKAERDHRMEPYRPAGQWARYHYAAERNSARRARWRLGPDRKCLGVGGGQADRRSSAWRPLAPPHNSCTGHGLAFTAPIGLDMNHPHPVLTR